MIQQRKYMFIVAGKGDFPFRCLMMDKCWPASDQDAHKIALSCPTVAPLQRIVMNSHQHPTPLVWKEEKWDVLNIS